MFKWDPTLSVCVVVVDLEAAFKSFFVLKFFLKFVETLLGLVSEHTLSEYLHLLMFHHGVVVRFICFPATHASM